MVENMIQLVLEVVGNVLSEFVLWLTAWFSPCAISHRAKIRRVFQSSGDLLGMPIGRLESQMRCITYVPDFSQRPLCYECACASLSVS